MSPLERFLRQPGSRGPGPGVNSNGISGVNSNGIKWEAAPNAGVSGSGVTYPNRVAKGFCPVEARSDCDERLTTPRIDHFRIC